MENSSKETAIINFVRTGIQSFQYIEIKDRQLSTNTHSSHKKENPTRSITPSKSKQDISNVLKSRVLVPSNSTPATRVGKAFNNYISKVHDNSCNILLWILTFLASRREHKGALSKDFHKELEKKYGYTSQDEEDFNTYSNKKVSSIKKELQKENSKPKQVITEQQVLLIVKIFINQIECEEQSLLRTQQGRDEESKHLRKVRSSGPEARWTT